MFLSHNARIVCQAILENKPILTPLRQSNGAEYEPFSKDLLPGVVEMIHDAALIRRVYEHSKSLEDAARRNDLSIVRKLLGSPPTRLTSMVGDSIGVYATDYVKSVVSGNPMQQLDHPLSTVFIHAPGAIHALAGGPGSGKSAWAECLLWEMTHKNTVGVDISVELDRSSKVARYAQHLRGPSVGLMSLATGKVDSVLAGEAARELYANTNLKLVAGITDLEDVKSAMRFHAEESGAEMFVIDFIQKIRVPGVMKLYERLDIIVDELHALGLELGVTQYWLCQLNREGRKSELRPRMEDMEGSGKIEQIAWSAAILHGKENPAGSHYRPVDIYIDKNRYGTTGQLKSSYEGRTYDLVVDGQEPLIKRVNTPRVSALV